MVIAFPAGAFPAVLPAGPGQRRRMLVVLAVQGRSIPV